VHHICIANQIMCIANISFSLICTHPNLSLFYLLSIL
jgi:hypothetical protein